MRSLLIVVVCGFALACNKESPTSPTPTPANATRVIALEGSLSFGDVLIGQSREATVTIRNSGTGPMSLTGITASGGLTQHTAATPTTGSIPANGSLPILFRFAPTTAGTFSGTVTFTTDHTSGSNTLQMTGVGIGAPITVVGVVTDAVTRLAVGGVRVAALMNDASVRLLAETRTDGNGFYSMVVPSATNISLTFSRDGYNPQSSAVTFTADTRRDVTINPFWAARGVGDSVFDMPAFVQRVRVQAAPGNSCQNFIVRIGGRPSIINVILGTCSVADARTLDGTYLTGGGGVVSITNSTGVSWTFTQVQ